MLLKGNYTQGSKDYYFYRNETKSQITWVVFNKQFIADGQVYSVDKGQFLAMNKLTLQRLFVGAYCTSITECNLAGNVNVVNELMRTFNKALSTTYKDTTTEVKNNYLTLSQINSEYDYCKITREVDSSIITDINYVNGNTSINVFSATNTPIKHLNWITWEPVDLFKKSNADNNESILATRAKTIQQLRLLFDLSWYFDNNGKSKKNYKIIDSLEALDSLINNEFPNIDLWAVDVETTGLNVFKGVNADNFDHVVSLMMSWDKDQAIFIPIDMVYMKNIPEGWVEKLKPWLEKIKAVGHNISFDARALLCDFGIDLNIAYDTQQLNFNLNCYSAKMHNGLKYLEHKHFGIDTLELKDIFGTKKLAGLFRYLPRQLALIYACPDVDYCLQLFYLLWDKLPASCRKTFKLDMDTMKNLYKMDCLGNRVDVEFAQEYRKANNKDMELLKEVIFKIVGQSLLSNEYIDKIIDEFKNNIIDEETCKQKMQDFYESDSFKNAKYVFNVDSNKVLGNVLFNLLKYPVQNLSEKTGEPAVNASTFKKLLSYEKEVTSEDDMFLKQDIKSAVADIPRLANEKVPPLISKNEFNKLKYPLALLITEYRLRFKRNSTFFKQLLDESIEGKYYTTSKMANAETFRIINVVQTLQGFMKQMVIPYDDDHYLLVFDFSQIEYRYMAGMAGVTDLVKNLNNYRADFHRECCALLHNIKPWLVTSKMRKSGKSLNFAIPYGMGVQSIARDLFGVVNEKTKMDANRQLAAWQSSFHQIWDYLEEKRDFAIRNGYVESILGRRRYFYGDEGITEWRKNLGSGKKASVRRAAGNFPIQEGATDLFRIALNRFRARLDAEGLRDLVLTTATVHDELVNSVHKSVNPYYLYKIIFEECMLNLKGHPRYFAGISICDNWHEGKDDLYEAPMEFVAHMVLEKPEISNVKFMEFENPKDKVLTDIKDFMKGVFLRDFGNIGFNINSKEQDLKSLMNRLEDYFLREKLGVYYPLPSDGSHGKVNKKFENDVFVKAFEEFLIQEGPLDEYIIYYPDNYPEGTIAKLTKSGREFLNNDSILQSNTATSFFTEQSPRKKETQDDLDLDLDFDLDLETEESTNADLSSIDALMMMEIEEGEMFGNTSSYYFFEDTSDLVNTFEEKNETEDIINNPDKYIKMYDSYSSNVRLSSDKLILNFTGIPEAIRSNVRQYLQDYLVSKDTLGCVEVVYKIGSQFSQSSQYIKNYDILKLQNLFKEPILS